MRLAEITEELANPCRGECSTPWLMRWSELGTSELPASSSSGEDIVQKAPTSSKTSSAVRRLPKAHSTGRFSQTRRWMLRRLLAMAPAAAPACRTLSGGSGTSPGATQVVIALGTNEVSAIPSAPGCRIRRQCPAAERAAVRRSHTGGATRLSSHLRYLANHPSRTPRESNVTHPGMGMCAAAEGAACG